MGVSVYVLSGVFWKVLVQTAHSFIAKMSHDLQVQLPKLFVRFDEAVASCLLLVRPGLGPCVIRDPNNYRLVTYA